MKNLASNFWLLEEGECLIDAFDESMIITGPDQVRNNTYTDKGVLFQSFEGTFNRLKVGVKANTPEEAVSPCGSERK